MSRAKNDSKKSSIKVAYTTFVLYSKPSETIQQVCVASRTNFKSLFAEKVRYFQ